MSRDDDPGEVYDERGRPLSLGGRIRLAFRADPTKGAVVFLLLLFGVAFLLAGVVVFWSDILAFLESLL